ncbi:hypothetical protein [Glacieibacterium sp.]|uniref:FliH/SctL family protein n=1 Tax=Glacieibacterium sp. TaxID=2860237 RepID=UPI003B00EEF3
MFEAATPLSALLWAMNPGLIAAPSPDCGAIAAAADAVGYARGWTEAEAALQPLRDRLGQAAQALDAASVIDPASLTPLFVTLVRRIAEVVVDGELRQSPEVLERLVASAFAAVDTEGATLRLSPRDAALLGMGTIDLELSDGEIRVDTARHVVAASLATRLAEAVAGLV